MFLKSKKMLVNVCLFVLIVPVMLIGCGYKLTINKELPCGIGTVFVEMFENNSIEVGLEYALANCLVKELTRYSPKCVVDKGSADAIITGSICSFYDEGIHFDSVIYDSNLTKHIVAEIELNLESSEGVILWKSNRIRGEYHYLCSSNDTEKGEANRTTAVMKLVERLSETVVQNLTEIF